MRDPFAEQAAEVKWAASDSCHLFSCHLFPSFTGKHVHEIRPESSLFSAQYKHVGRRHRLGRPRQLFGPGRCDGRQACHAEKLGWRLGVQAWSFHTETFSEAVDKTASLGLRYIEAIPGQKLSPDQPEMKVNECSSAETRKAIKQKLADAGVKLVNYGVCGLPKDADQSRRMFDFAKEMGIETIVSEPAEDAFDTMRSFATNMRLTSRFTTTRSLRTIGTPTPC